MKYVDPRERPTSSDRHNRKRSKLRSTIFYDIQGGNDASSPSDEEARVVDRDRIPIKIRFVPNASSEPRR